MYPNTTQRLKNPFWIDYNNNYNMIVWMLERNDINFSMAAGLIGLHMPGVK